MRRISFLGIAIILLFPLTTGAVPQLLKHQGYMSDNQGEPASGSANMIFNLYSVESEGESMWTQTIAVTFDEGHYKVVLGPGTPELSLDLLDGADLFLGITLEGAAEFMPRMKLASVPYAFKAEAVEGEVKAVGGLVVDGVEVINNQQEWSGVNISFGDLADIPEDLADGDDVGLVGNGTDGTLVKFTESGLADSVVVVNDGNLGVGTDDPQSSLHIAGSVQISDDSGDCVEDKAGTLRWHESQVEFCDGSDWKPLGGPLSPTGQSPEDAGVTCKTILEADQSQGDGTYWIAPPGFEDDPFEVQCDMTSDGGGWTVISHNREEWSDDDSCENHSCKVFDVTYEIPDENIIALMDISTEVKQTFHKKCHGSDMDCGGAETHFSNILGDELCPHNVLGIDFNCNQNDSVWRQDDLDLDQTTNLIPIKTLWGGDSGGGTEYSNYMIGKLYLR